MDLNERAKNNLFEFDIELETKKDKINEKYKLRKNHNQNKIMEKRKKRIFILNQNKNINGINESNGINDLQNSNQKILLNKSDISINLLLDKITNKNINIILDCLCSNDFEKTKWVLYSLRYYFEKNNPELNEYLILFENKIYLYFESLLKKYEKTIYIVNEILFIIANLFSRDEIIIKFPENYFLYFLNNSFLCIYQECFDYYKEEELIISAFILLENILQGQNNLIKEIFEREELIRSILNIFNDKKMYNFDIIDYFIKFFRIIINGLKNGYIKNKNLFYSIFDRIYFLYRLCDKKNQTIINKIIILIINAFDCKIKDKFENENYLMINYLFKERKELTNYNLDINFIHYFCRSIYNDSNFYLLNYEIFDSSLDFLEKLTDNCNKAQMQEIFDCENYKFLEILNNYYKYRIIPNSTDKNSEIDHIKKLLKICNNIIDAGLNFALGVVFSQFFDNLVIFFSKNLNNRRILENFLNTFIRLLGHYDKKIADNLFKRGIINECIFCYFLRGCNLNNCPFNEEIIAKMFKIISDYLQIVFGKNQESKLKREDYLLLHNFKEFIKNTDIISEETRVCLLHLDYMNMI